jgi:hypothetical protein
MEWGGERLFEEETHNSWIMIRPQKSLSVDAMRVALLVKKEMAAGRARYNRVFTFTCVHM